MRPSSDGKRVICVRPELRRDRVLIVGNWPPPLGGVSVHIAELASRILASSRKVTVLDIGRGRHRNGPAQPAERLARFPMQLMEQVAAHDLVHLHTSGANVKSWMLVASVGLTARVTGRPAFVTFHSGHLVRYLDAPSRAVTARASLSAYDRVICVNEAIEERLRRVGAADRRRVIVPAFGRPQARREAGAPPRFHAFRAEHRRVIAAALAPGRDYGAEPLLEAFRRLRDEREDVGLLLFGEGTEGLDSAQAHVLGLGERPHHETLAMLASADLFVRPTLVDGDSISVREALSLGLPTVATSVGHRPSGVHLCAPGSADALRQAMSESLDRPRSAPVGAPDGIGLVLDLYAARLEANAPQVA